MTRSLSPNANSASAHSGEWPSVPLSRVAEINPSRPRGLRRDDASPTTFVPMAAVDEKHGVIASPTTRPFSEVRKGYTYFEEGDVLFAKITPCMQNGKHAIARDTIDGIGFASTEFHVIRPGLDILPEWIHFFLRQPSVLEAAVRAFTGAAGQQRVPPDFLATLPIPLPPLPEQRRIAAKLSEQMEAVNRATRAAEGRHHACEFLLSALLRAAFFGITPLTAARVRDKSPDGWRWRKLTDIARLESGHTPSRYHPEWWGGDIRWLALPDIRALDGKEALETIEHTNELGIQNSSARVLPRGTVVLSRTASVGFVAVMGRPMATSQDFVNWVCGDELEPWFLAYLLMASRHYIRALSSGAVHKTVYMPTAKAFEVCIPGLQEQRRIASNLASAAAAAETAAGAARGCLTVLHSLPASLLRRAFSGGI